MKDIENLSVRNCASKAKPDVKTGVHPPRPYRDPSKIEFLLLEATMKSDIRKTVLCNAFCNIPCLPCVPNPMSIRKVLYTEKYLGNFYKIYKHLSQQKPEQTLCLAPEIGWLEKLDPITLDWYFKGLSF